MGVRRRLVLTGVLTGALAACSPDRGPAPATDGASTAPDGLATPGAATASGPGVDVAAGLLAARSAALLAGDLDGAGNGSVPAVRAAQRRSDERAVAAGTIEWSVADLTLGPVRSDGTAPVTGTLQTRVEGEGRAVRGTLRSVLVPDGPRWLLSPDLPAPDPLTSAPLASAPLPPDFAAPDAGTPSPWDLGAVQARRVPGGVLLVVSADPAPTGGALAVPDPSGPGVEGLASDLAEDLGPATARVDAVWGADWPRGTAVVLVPTVDLAARLAGLDPARVALLDALAVGQDAPLADGRPAGVRVVVAAGPFGGLSRAGRRITLTHELVHVATRAGTSVRPADPQDRPLPRWLVEGYADFVARQDSGIDPVRLAAALLDAVAAGAPVQVPADADFDAAQAGPLQIAYAAAWTLVVSAARRAGPVAVTAWYRALATAPELGGTAAGRAPDRLEAACRAALGRDWATVRGDWTADVVAGLPGWS